MSVVAQEIRNSRLSVLVKSIPGLPMEDGLANAAKAGVVMALNRRMSHALIGSDEWRGIAAALPCWTGTMTAYVKPDEKLGKTIEYVDPKTGNRYVFPVPEEHQGKKNAILVAEHPDYILEIDGKNRVVRAAQVDLVERFPASDGSYLGDAKHDIPQGEQVNSASDEPRRLWSTDNDEARRLWRIEKRVGLAVRVDSGGRYIVALSVPPSDCPGPGVVCVDAAEYEPTK